MFLRCHTMALATLERFLIHAEDYRIEYLRMNNSGLAD